MKFGKGFVTGLVIFAPMILRSSNLFLIVFVSLLLASSCNSSKSYYKKGSQLIIAGLSEEAAEYYLLALKKNSNNIDARIALKKSGQDLLEEKLQSFYKLYTAEDYIGATKKYIEAVDYQNLVSPYVKLEIPPYYIDYFNESKVVFLDENYNKAKQLIEENKFEAANARIVEIESVDPNYKDVASLKNYSNVEPIYLEALKFFEAENYHKSYDLFVRVIKMNGNYKQAPYYRDESLVNGRLTIAILPFEDESKTSYMSASLKRLILQGGSSKKDPFLVYIDRENMDALLNEQKLGLTGVIDENTAAETGKLLGAKFLIKGRIINYNHIYEPLQTRVETAYEERTVRKYNSVQGYYYNQKTYVKTNYKLNTIKRTVECKIELSLISTETGEVVLSQSYSQKKDDNLQFGEYSKDAKNLYPGYYKSLSYASAEDLVDKSIIEKQKLERVIAQKRRQTKSEEQLGSLLLEEVATNWVWKIRKYEKSLE
ncbi:MAG: CsgG/HfaB family protein [Salibacteraceae bacterium]